ncbi:MAG: hypothetical protein ACRBBS_00800 [Thalassovita sp.]
MSTRATITVVDEHDSFDIYQHHDGYPGGPYGLVCHIAMARRLAWVLPRFEAADFAAAIIAVLKGRGGSTYLTKEAKAHGDRTFHYRVEAARDDASTRVQLTITQPSWKRGKTDIEVFTGDIQAAVRKYNAAAETSDQPREWQMLGEIEGALCRAEEEISQWVKGAPEPDTQATLDDLDDAGRAMCQLRHHLEKTDPWSALGKAETILETIRKETDNQSGGLATTEVHLTMEAHRRFQRD